MYATTFSILFAYFIFKIILLAAAVDKQQAVSMNRCWRKLCVANCGQNTADSDMVTIDSL